MDQFMNDLRAETPNIDELWDPNSPVAVNCYRLASRETRPNQQGQRQSQHRGGIEQFQTPEQKAVTSLLEELENRSPAARQDPDFLRRLNQYPTTGRAYTAECKDIIAALRKPASHKLQTPLLALQQQVANIFKHGPERATGIFGSLSAAAQSGLTKAEIPDSDLPLSWKSCKAAATLVGLLACPADRVYKVVKFLSQMLGGLPTYHEIRNTPSTSLQTAFKNAKALARGEKGISSVIMVSLTDVHIFELAQQRTRDGSEADKYTSFAHSFVLGIGPEGVVVWQSWGEHGYVDQWIKDGGARVQTWQEAGDLVDVFEKFAAYKGKWDAKRNKLYQKVFDVDIFQICGAKGLSKPIVPKAESWVRLLVMEDVKLDDIYKFTFE